MSGNFDTTPKMDRGDDSDSEVVSQYTHRMEQGRAGPSDYKCVTCSVILRKLTLLPSCLDLGFVTLEDQAANLIRQTATAMIVVQKGDAVDPGLSR